MPPAAAELGSIPLLRSRHSVMVSSITNLVSSSSETSTERSRRVHSLSLRTHVHGSDQSIRMTTSVSGTDLGVKSGLRRGANDGEGSDKRYAETRARVSAREKHQHMPDQRVHSPCTFFISIEDISICVSKRKLIGNWWCFPFTFPLVVY